MSDDVQQRAAEVIYEADISVFEPAAERITAALAAANLLADPDTARQRRLGEAVEKLRAVMSVGDVYGNELLDLIYAEAEVEQ